MRLPIGLKSLTLGLVLTTQMANAQVATEDRTEWTYNDHWENTQIEFDKLIFGTINQNTCTTNIKEMMGCMAVINKVYELQYPNQNVLVTYTPSAASESAPFSIEEYPGLTAKEFFAVKKEYFKELYNEYNKLLTDAKGLVSFPAQRILKEFTEKMVTEANDQMMAGTLYNEYLTLAYDPHTYIYPTTYLQDSAKPNVRRKGIGIYFHIETVNGNDHYILDEVIENSPAEKYGLQSGDVILKANKAETTEEVYKVISNEEIITFDVLRGDQNIQIELTKDYYEVSQVQTSVLHRDGKKYGYIKLRTFTDVTACDRITAAGKKMVEEDQIEGVILDLRNNGGGLVTQMQCISKLYLEDGSRTWAVKYLDQEDPELIEETERFTNNIFGDLHTVTLINGRSASASEATSMYLQDYRKSFIVGEQSFGKGSMQGVGATPDDPTISKGSTRALYYGPKGISPQVRGVTPDFIAYPKFGQKEATPMTRESDRYLFVIENEVSAQDLEDADRKEEIVTINNCMSDNKAVEKRFNTTAKAKQRIFDNQLEVGINVIACANENVNIYKSTDIQVAEGVEFIDRYELMRRYFERMKPKSPALIPTKLPPLKLKPIKIVP